MDTQSKTIDEEKKPLPTEQQMKEAMDALEKACMQLKDLGCEFKPGIQSHWGGQHPYAPRDPSIGITIYLSIQQPIGDGQYRERRSYGMAFSSEPIRRPSTI